MAQAAVVQTSKSTIDRFFTSPAQTFGWGRSLAPQLAERWAFERFMTPRRIKSVAGEQTVAGARALQVELGPRGERVAAWQWGEGPPVLLIHGWEGRAAQFAEFIGPLVERGFSAVAFDAPAHGQSPGTRASLRTFALAAQNVAARVGRVQGVIGHSLGALATLLALRGSLQAESAVLIAPPSPGAHFAQFAGHLELNDAERERIARRIEIEVGLPFAKVEGSDLAAGVTTAGLVIHDRRDKEAPWHYGAATAAAWPDAVLHTTESLGHRRILRDRTVVDAAVSFIARHRLGLAESADLHRWLDFHEPKLMAG